MKSYMVFDAIIKKSKYDIKYITHKASLHKVNPKLVFKLKEELEKEFAREDYSKVYTDREKNILMSSYRYCSRRVKMLSDL